MAMDLGPKNNCAAHAAMYKFGLNYVQWADACHGAHRDFILWLKGMRLYDFWIVVLVHCNLPHGSEINKDSRCNQLKKAMDYYYKTFDYRTAPLFQDGLRKIAQELQALHVMLPHEAEEGFEIWNYLKSQAPVKKKGRKCSFNRFLAAAETPEECMKYFHQDKHERTFLGIEMDFLRGKKFGERLKILAKPGTDAHGEEGGPTDSRVTTVIERSIMGCCANAVAVSVAFLHDPFSLRTCQCVFEDISSLKHWQ
eukprot:8315948-Pyramimonas_sp.AAC.2